MSFADHVADYRRRLERALAVLDSPALERLADELETLRRSGGRLYVLGNGGSAATAAHLANDLCAGLGDRGLDATALADSLPAVTAMANDHGYDDMFVRMLTPRLRAGDALLLLSGSGNSPNLLRAVALAKERGALTAAIVGMDGGALAGVVDVAVHAPGERGDYGPAEDIQLVVDHVLASWLRRT